jgi:hypothetical protein
VWLVSPGLCSPVLLENGARHALLRRHRHLLPLSGRPQDLCGVCPLSDRYGTVAGRCRLMSPASLRLMRPAGRWPNPSVLVSCSSSRGGGSTCASCVSYSGSSCDLRAPRACRPGLLPGGIQRRLHQGEDESKEHPLCLVSPRSSDF